MKINRSDFLKILSQVKPGLSKREIVEQSTHFIFTGSEIVTNNEYICIHYPLETDFQCSIKADEFYKLIQSMPDEDIKIVCDKDLQIKINGKMARAGLLAVKEKQSGQLFDIKSFKKWKTLPDDFIQGVYLCMFSISKDPTLEMISCLSINNSKISSSDNLRISQYVIEGFKEKILLPLQSVIELVKYEVKQYHIGDSWIHFKTGNGLIFSARLMKGDFPDVDNFFELKGNKINFPKELQEALKLIKIAVEDSADFVNQKIMISISKDKIICRGEGSIGWIEHDVSFSYNGKPFEFYIHPLFLIEILNKTKTMIISDNKALFVVDKFKHVMSLPE